MSAFIMGIMEGLTEGMTETLEVAEKVEEVWNKLKPEDAEESHTLATMNKAHKTVKKGMSM